MSCPSSAITGFLNFSSVPDTTPFQQAVGPNASPFFMAFAPRTTPISILNGTNNIQENRQNTITYKNSSYLMESAQICKPNETAFSYSIYGTNPLRSINKANIATLIFTFTISSPDKSYPNQLVLIVPIYIGSETNTSGYLTQMLNPGAINASYPSLQTLFTNQPSFAYMACITGNSVAYNIMMYTFVNGIVLTEQNWAELQKKLPNGVCPPYTPSVGLNIPFLPRKPPTDEDIINKVTFYRLDIQPATKIGYNTNQNLKTTQYQCQPFDQLKNLQIEPEGVKRVSLDQIIKASDSAMIGVSFSFNDLAAVFWPIAGILLALVCLGLYFFFSSGKEPLPPTAGGAGAAGAGAGGVGAVDAAAASRSNVLSANSTLAFFLNLVLLIAIKLSI